MKLSDLFEDTPEEPKRKTQSKTKTKFDDKIFDRSSKGDLAPKDEPKEKSKSDDYKHKSAGKTETSRRMRGVDMSPEAGEKLSHLSRSNLRDTISDEEAARIAGASSGAGIAKLAGVDTTTANLPKIISTALALLKTDVAKIDEKGIAWHDVKHLPGSMSSAIRSIGRSVFAPFTKTPIENIQVIANLGGGPNTKDEMAFYGTVIKKHGTRDRDLEIEFQDHIPNYQADVVIYHWLGYTFFIVKDFAGVYIYSWSSKDNVKEFKHEDPVSLPSDRKMLAKK